MPRLAPTQREEVCQRYIAGKGSPELGREFGVSAQAVCALLQRRGIKRRSQHEVQMKCSLNENAFSPPSEASAYWVGFLMADGTVIQRSLNSFEIAIVLSARDVGHLQAFRCFLGSSHKIVSAGHGSYGGSNPSVRFAVRSVKLAEALSRFGVTPRKTFTAHVVGLENNRHFWRGVVDGDGSIGVISRGLNKGRPRFGLTGAQPLLEQFKVFLRSEMPNCGASVHPSKNSYCLSTCGKYAKGIITLLYQSCTIALERKMATAQHIMT